MSRKKLGPREALHEVIFEANTPLGKLFDILLLWAIILSVLAVVLESVPAYRARFGEEFRVTEWIFTILFTVEYLLRIFAVRKPLGFIFSFYGLIDLMAILPSYLSFYFTGLHSLLVIRAFRLLRVFIVLKLGRYLGEANVLAQALKASRPKITVFLLAVLSIVLIVGTCMYLIEGEKSGFTSIPMAVYWAIVTMTTVGYGDLIPQTDIGRFLASIIMIMGYGIIAVPTGIVSMELSQVGKGKHNHEV
jgi:voltage-gated potassium channel